MPNTEQKQHYLPAFYIRRFGFETVKNPKTEKQKKNGIRVFTLNKKGETQKRNPQTLCRIAGFNTEEQETLFGKTEKIYSESVDAIISGYYNSADIENTKGLIAYILSNTPNIRRQLTRKIEESTGSSLKNKINKQGGLTALMTLKIYHALSDWDPYIERIKPTQNKQFITSDNPVHMQPNEGFQVGGGWILTDTNSPRKEGDQNLYKHYPFFGNISISKETIFYFPLNPITAIFLYHDPKRRQDIIDSEHLVEGVNLNLIIDAKEYAIGHNKAWLKLMYKAYVVNKG